MKPLRLCLAALAFAVVAACGTTTPVGLDPDSAVQLHDQQPTTPPDTIPLSIPPGDGSHGRLGTGD